MIRVTVELLPQGSTIGKRTLAVLNIANTGGTNEVGEYRAELHAEYTHDEPRKGTLVGFKRKNQSVWSLIGGFLKLFGHTRHPPSLMKK